MKVAVLADIHGNLPALRTVVDHIDRWRPDAVVVAGDVVNRGPRPLECLQIIEQRRRDAGWLVVQGNHEEYVINHTRPEAPRSGPEFEIYRTSYWTLNQLNGQVDVLKEMPFQVSLRAPDGNEIRTVHASMRSNRDGIFPDTPDDSLRQQISPPPAALCVGHTHQALMRYIDDTIVVNVGSVGMPFDGDKRAAYAQLTWRNNQLAADIIRLDYDQDQMDRDFFETGFVPDAGALTSLMLVEFRHARPYLHLWMRRYGDPVLSGEISIDEAVDDYIAALGS
jgi:putative phosphoesterase